MQAICLLLGVPEADRHLLFDAVEHIFDIPDESDFLSMTPSGRRAVELLYEYGADSSREKRATPVPDMLSTVIHAELPDADPPRLSDDELSAFFSLLFSAGAETTRNAIAGAMLAFVEWPEQLGLLRSGRAVDGHAVEEILRWTTPSPSKRRTATSVLRARRRIDQPGPEGGRLGGLGQPGPEALRRAGRVRRSQRDPNPHLSFGHGVALLPRRAPRAPGDPRRARRGTPLHRVVHACRARRSGRAATAIRASAISPCGWSARRPPTARWPDRRRRDPRADRSCSGTPRDSSGRRSRSSTGELLALPRRQLHRGVPVSGRPKIMVARPAGSQRRHAPMPS